MAQGLIRIRAATADDAAAIAGIYAPHVAAGTASFETEPPSAEEMATRMAAAGGHYPWLVATVGDEAPAVIGYAHAGRFNERAGYRFAVATTVYVAGGQERRGAGRLLYGALLATLRAQEFTQGIALISLPNEASIALH